MGNKLREIFTKDENATIKFLNKTRAIKLEMLQDHHCEYCIHALEHPHVAYGEDGTDIFCPIFNELKLGYDDGMQCIFWEENTDNTNKRLTNMLTKNHEKKVIPSTRCGTTIILVCAKVGVEYKHKSELYHKALEKGEQ